MKKIIDKTRKRLKRKASIRKRIRGTPERPRITVYKSNRHTYVQAIDDAAGPRSPLPRTWRRSSAA